MKNISDCDSYIEDAKYRIVRKDFAINVSPENITLYYPQIFTFKIEIIPFLKIFKYSKTVFFWENILDTGYTDYEEAHKEVMRNLKSDRNCIYMLVNTEIENIRG